MSDDLKVFKMKHPGGCSGMFWRSDPRGGAGSSSTGSKPDWPRNGALLKGRVLEIPSKPEGSLKWLEVTEYVPAGGKNWVKTPGCFMQFDQGGTLLFEQ